MDHRTKHQLLLWCSTKFACQRCYTVLHWSQNVIKFGFSYDFSTSECSMQSCCAIIHCSHGISVCFRKQQRFYGRLIARQTWFRCLVLIRLSKYEIEFMSTTRLTVHCTATLLLNRITYWTLGLGYKGPLHCYSAAGMTTPTNTCDYCQLTRDCAWYATCLCHCIQRVLRGT